MEKYVNIFKLFSDETRLRILSLLKHKELCVCELVELTKLTQPKISKHIAKLRQSNVVKTKKNEQFIYYSLNDEHSEFHLISSMLERISVDEIVEMDRQMLDQKTTFVCERA